MEFRHEFCRLGRPFYAAPLGGGAVAEAYAVLYVLTYFVYSQSCVCIAVQLVFIAIASPIRFKLQQVFPGIPITSSLEKSRSNRSFSARKQSTPKEKKETTTSRS